MQVLASFVQQLSHGKILLLSGHSFTGLYWPGLFWIAHNRDTEERPGAFDETDGCCEKGLWCSVAMRCAYHELLQLGFLLAIAIA